MVLLILLAVAFFQASDVIGGMGSAAIAPMPGGRRGFGGPAGGPALDPMVGLNDLSKPLRSKLLAVPALQASYLAHVREIADRWLDWNKIAPLVVEYQALIDAEVRLDGRKLYGYDRFNPAALQTFFEQRRAFLLQ